MSTRRQASPRVTWWAATQEAGGARAGGEMRSRATTADRRGGPVSSAPPPADGHPELPEPIREGRPSAEAAERALVRKPQIGDTRPAPVTDSRPGRARGRTATPAARRGVVKRPDRTRGKRRAGRHRAPTSTPSAAAAQKRHGRAGSRAQPAAAPDAGPTPSSSAERRGPRAQRPPDRALPDGGAGPPEGMAQVAVLEGRNLIEHYVSRPADDVSQIHGNIYLGRVQNVLPGHGGRVRRHRHAEERRAVPRRRAVRRRRTSSRSRASCASRRSCGPSS